MKPDADLPSRESSGCCPAHAALCTGLMSKRSTPGACADPLSLRLGEPLPKVDGKAVDGKLDPELAAQQCVKECCPTSPGVRRDSITILSPSGARRDNSEASPAEAEAQDPPQQCQRGHYLGCAGACKVFFSARPATCARKSIGEEDNTTPKGEPVPEQCQGGYLLGSDGVHSDISSTCPAKRASEDREDCDEHTPVKAQKR
jgi:hypothetical protein